MTLIKDLLALRQSQSEVVEEEQLDEARRSGDLAELIEKWMDHNKAYNLEGSRGIRNLLKLTAVLDGAYRDLDSFFEDNSGALQAVVEWLGSQRSPEWAENLKNNMPGGEDDDE